MDNLELHLLINAFKMLGGSWIPPDELTPDDDADPYGRREESEENEGDDAERDTAREDYIQEKVTAINKRSI